MTTDFMKTS